jgi:iron-sulfur cluster repair protein YtfE (RIC family)
MSTLDAEVGLSEYMRSDHRRCEALLVQAEQVASARRWDSGAAACRMLKHALAHHLAMEEHVLFPVLEGSRTAPASPADAMRLEHEEIRELLAELSEALQSSDRDGFLERSESLRVIMQRHHLKEERVLYPLAEQVLGDSAAEVLKAMQHVAADMEAG